jgi:hypothetical protein
MRPLVINRHRSILALALVVATAAAASAGPADPPLNRNLGAYLKNFILSSPCNIGVNCKQPTTSSECGNAIFEDPNFADGSQLAADIVKFSVSGGSVWQVFRNGGSSTVGTTIRHPGMQPDGTNLLDPLPILQGDPDGDGNPTCGPNCTPDYGDIEKLCGFPTVFPGCNPGLPITVANGADCNPLAQDQVPGNGRCDLAAGAYGDLQVQNFGKVTFQGGDYEFCSVTYGRNTNTIADAPSVINIPAPGSMNVNNESTFGTKCGDITVHMKGAGTFSLGRNVNVNAFVCAPQALVTLGDSNKLTGQFVGDVVQSNKNNDGFCCGGGGSCTCVDTFAPTTAKVGDTITFTSNCDLNNATAVTICGINANISTKSASELKAVVPAGASGPCVVKISSAVGTYTAAGTLTVTP